MDVHIVSDHASISCVCTFFVICAKFRCVCMCVYVHLCTYVHVVCMYMHVLYVVCMYIMYMRLHSWIVDIPILVVAQPQWPGCIYL